MALLYRNKSMKPFNLFNHFKRHYFQIHTPRFSINRTSPITIADYLHNHHFANAPKYKATILRPEHFLSSRVRYFAAPVQVVKKKEVKLKRPRLNEEIDVAQIRLVEEDESHYVISTKEAMERAKELELDLVEVNRLSKPPVCRIMDYKREQYKKQVRKKEIAKMKAATSLKSGACKEVRFSLKAELKDLKFKADTVKRLMERGYRVKCMVLATSEDQELGGLLNQISELIEDVGLVESEPKIEKRQGYLMVRHKKFGPTKGNRGSKAKQGATSKTSTYSDGNVESEEQINAEKSGMDNDDEESDLDSDSEVEAPLKSQNETSRTVSPASTSQVPNLTPNMSPPAHRFENRYARKVPNKASPPRNPTTFPNRSPPQPGGFRQAANDGQPPRNFPPRQNEDRHPQAEIPNQGRQSDRNFTPYAGPSRPPNFTGSRIPQSPNDGPPPRNFPPRQNPNWRPQPENSNQGRQTDGKFTPHVVPPRPPNFTGNRVPQSPNFGIFSGEKANASKLESGGEANQQSGGRQPSVPRNSAPGDPNSSTPSSGGPLAGSGKKWGIFSAESSNPTPGKSS